MRSLIIGMILSVAMLNCESSKHVEGGDKAGAGGSANVVNSASAGSPAAPASS